MIAARALLFITLLPAVAQAGAIANFTDRSAFQAAAGLPLTVEGFTDWNHFSIWTGVLNSQTDIRITYGTDIKPGDIKPGVTYTSPTPPGTWDCYDYFNSFGIDTYPGYQGGFLTRPSGSGTPEFALTATFDLPANAVGFDTNFLMGTSFNIRIRFASGPDFVQDYPVAATGMSFFGFVSDSRDILSVSIYGRGSNLAFAVDNFTFTSVPEPSSMVLGSLAAAMIAGVSWTRRSKGARESSRRHSEELNFGRVCRIRGA